MYSPQLVLSILTHVIQNRFNILAFRQLGCLFRVLQNIGPYDPHQSAAQYYQNIIKNCQVLLSSPSLDKSIVGYWPIPL